MDIRHRTEIIAGYYSRLKDFQWSEKYSRSDQIVYTASDPFRLARSRKELKFFGKVRTECRRV